MPGLFKKGRSKEEIDRMKNIVETFIDKNMDPWRKALFYSDPDVKKILKRLYNEWEDSDYNGKPIDYANPNELEVLAKKALSAGLGDISRFQRELSRDMIGEDRRGR